MQMEGAFGQERTPEAQNGMFLYYHAPKQNSQKKID